MSNKSCTCKNCGGKIEYDSISDVMECPYCGSEFTIDESDEVKIVRIKAATYKDTTISSKILDNEKTSETHKYEIENKKLNIYIFLVIALVIAIVGFVMFRGIGHTKNTTIKMSDDIRNYIGMDYETVISYFKDMGFSEENITVTEKATLDKSQLAEREGKIITVAVGGDPSVKKDSRVPKDSKIQIEYEVLDPSRENDIQIPAGFTQIMNMHYMEAAKLFHDNGFTNIQLKGIADVKAIKSEYTKNLVSLVSIAENTEFVAEKWVPADSLVLIEYHIKKSNNKDELTFITDSNVIMPKASKEYKGNYQDIKDELEKLGFTDIETRALQDIKAGILADEGEIKTLTINAKDTFEQYEIFEKDAEIVISYHSKKDKPEINDNKTEPAADANASNADNKTSESSENTSLGEKISDKIHQLNPFKKKN